MSAILTLQRVYGNAAVAAYLSGDPGGPSSPQTLVRRLVQRQEEQHTPLEMAPSAPGGGGKALASTTQEEAKQGTGQDGTAPSWTPGQSSVSGALPPAFWMLFERPRHRQ